MRKDMTQPEMADDLFKRVADIVEQARASTVRAVNINMVAAYWLIGREIVQVLQTGENRAAYGKSLIAHLSERMTRRYGRGFSASNLRKFRQFYQAFSDRQPSILYLPGTESENEKAEQNQDGGIWYPAGTKLSLCFRPELSWSHYRALMHVKNQLAREFYESEAVECGWNKTQLERQIHTAYYERIIQNRGDQGLLDQQRERLPGQPISPDAMLKSPYVLEFLNLPDSPVLHENQLEQAIIDNLQSFLLELGRGFSFVARQKHLRFDDDDFYVDLVFYNFILKCFLLIDLKIGKLTHRDVGQMDGYVRLYEDRFKVQGDNPTIGLILCSDKSESVAKYSVLNEGKQIFASKYLQYLPSESELQEEIAKERTEIENAIKERQIEYKLGGEG